MTIITSYTQFYIVLWDATRMARCVNLDIDVLPACHAEVQEPLQALMNECITHELSSVSRSYWGLGIHYHDSATLDRDVFKYFNHTVKAPHNRQRADEYLADILANNNEDMELDDIPF